MGGMKHFWISVSQLAGVMLCFIALGVYTAQSGNGWPAWMTVCLAAALLIAVAMRQYSSGSGVP
jgi:hypothetical protein